MDTGATTALRGDVCNNVNNYANLAQFMTLSIRKTTGIIVSFDSQKVMRSINRAIIGYENDISVDLILDELGRVIFDGISSRELSKGLMLAAAAFIEQDPAYSHVSTRFFLQAIYKEVMGSDLDSEKFEQVYCKKFIDGIRKGIEIGHLDKRLADFDLEAIAAALKPERDDLFRHLGIQALYERYLLKSNDQRYEAPQMFWMRVAMGLCLLEENKTERVIDFYNLLSTLRFVSSTPTLLHSGTVHPQLSSCYLTFVDDDLHHIFKCFGDNAQMAKWSGGVANDWSSIRSTGAGIKSIKIGSQGLIPFLKIANDVVSAINRSGSRRGATVAYLECWHHDFEDFLDLRRNTGDERRRAHDMNTASWIPDLFMKRLIADKQWTLFSPDEVPDLHEVYGKKFEERYEFYEQQVAEGKIRLFKQMPAKDLWRKMLSRLFETGHPWMTFKDACNLRSPQDHVGVVHSSNLCTEITLNTSRDETAVCNLGSINLAQHMTADGQLDKQKVAATIATAIRMLDNVVDINFYPTQEGKNSNARHRPIGMGVMGLQDAMFIKDIAFDQEEALTFSDESMEFISYHAILNSSKLAKERGAYSSFKGSKWDRGIFPIDTISLLEEQRGVKIDVNRNETLDWAPVREHVKQHGMRNSNVMAIAPTATISNISNCFPCIEPIYKNIYVKANMSGEFTVINKYLVDDLKKIGLWNKDMLDQVKYYDGSIQMIDAIPDKLKHKYKEAFEIDPEWLLKVTAARGKWIDQSQSHNVFMKGTSGKKLNDIYIKAWKLGLKSTYYLRTLGATQIEKSTLDAKKFGYTQKREYSDMNEKGSDESAIVNGAACGFNPEECESCQ